MNRWKPYAIVFVMVLLVGGSLSYAQVEDTDETGVGLVEQEETAEEMATGPEDEETAAEMISAPEDEETAAEMISAPEDEALDRSRAERTYERGLNPAGVGRQLRAILASGNRKTRLHNVRAPTLVIHGTVDPLVHPMGGRDTAASIPGAKLLMIEGMGHAIPVPMWPEIIDAIDQHAHGSAKKAA